MLVMYVNRCQVNLAGDVGLFLEDQPVNQILCLVSSALKFCRKISLAQPTYIILVHLSVVVGSSYIKKMNF